MKVKLKKDIGTVKIDKFGKNHPKYGIVLDSNKIYEVVGIIIMKRNNETEIEIIYDKHNFWSFPMNLFEIVDPTIPNDWVVFEQLGAYQMLPKILAYEDFREDFADGYREAEKIFYNRFAGKIYPDKEYEFEEYFVEYQNPKIEIVAEAVGDNWVICPECNEAFEVKAEQGVVKCTGCYTKMNNPYAKEFLIKEDNKGLR
jgi:hypothetical protein